MFWNRFKEDENLIWFWSFTITMRKIRMWSQWCFIKVKIKEMSEIWWKRNNWGHDQLINNSITLQSSYFSQRLRTGHSFARFLSTFVILKQRNSNARYQEMPSLFCYNNYCLEILSLYLKVTKAILHERGQPGEPPIRWLPRNLIPPQSYTNLLILCNGTPLIFCNPFFFLL